MLGPFLKPTSIERQSLGKYDLLGQLTTGGIHDLYLATQKGLGGFRKIVVLKSILPDTRGEEEFVRRFLEAARITSSFNHPNIAQVFDLDTDEETLFVAMEFVQGATLVEIERACREKNEALPMGFILASVRDAALALHYAHTFTDTRGRQVNVIHRDVSSKHVMVDYEGTTKLLDFGIAKSLGGTPVINTAIGELKGTRGYMSPEQVLGDDVDHRSDVFSLGVVLHELLTSQRLFTRPTIEEELRAAMQEVEPPSKSNPSISAALDHATLKALAPKRDQRFATALEFARAIETAAQGLLWNPEQSGELVKRLHAARLKETHNLLHQQGGTSEHLAINDAPTGTAPAISLAPLAALGEGRESEHPTGVVPTFVLPTEEDQTVRLLMRAPPMASLPTASMRAPSGSLPQSVVPAEPSAPTYIRDAVQDYETEPASLSRPFFIDTGNIKRFELEPLPEDKTISAAKLPIIVKRKPPIRSSRLAFGVALVIVPLVGAFLALQTDWGSDPPPPLDSPVPRPAPPVEPPPPEPVAATPPAVVDPPLPPQPPPTPPKTKAKKSTTKKTVKKKVRK